MGDGAQGRRAAQGVAERPADIGAGLHRDVDRRTGRHGGGGVPKGQEGLVDAQAAPTDDRVGTFVQAVCGT
ncbi:hypothetical protein D3C72_1284510 [compost metagenome]